MSEQINLNKDGGERDYGPFTNGDREDISPAMKETMELVAKMEFPSKNGSVDANKEKQEQSQDSLSNNEQIKH